MSLRVYNTLTRRKEEFKPRDKGKVAMYVCGPTVYYYIHVGNARCYLNFDTIKRYLEFKGYDVLHVMNYTDVDDKVINQAKEEGVSASEVAQKYTEAFIDDMDHLNLKPANLTPKATEHIPEMIDMIETLIEKGYAYEVDGDVYFEIAKKSDYGKLSHRSIEEVEAGARVEIDPRKRDPLDFALWKKAKPDEPSWDSPWGKGRPGWHIECSAMSLKYLGMSFDIHGGGQDLIFPHHENEIAQSESFIGKKPFVRYWLHNGFINIEGEKMAKSLGNIILVRDVLKNHDPAAVKMLFLGTHYRSPIDFSEEKLEEAGKSYERLNNLVGNLERVIENYKGQILSDPTEIQWGSGISQKTNVAELKEMLGRGYEHFERAMDDDFNTPNALGALFNLTRDVNTYIAGKEHLSAGEVDLLEEIKGAIIKLGDVLGLEFVSFITPKDVTVFPAPLRVTSRLKKSLVLSEDLKDKLIEGWMRFSGAKDREILRKEIERDFDRFVQNFIDLRDRHRSENNWAKADEIRAFLSKLDIVLEDTKYGTKARIRRKF